MAETIPEPQLLTTDGYILILQKILNAHQAYLEAELEKAAVDFLYSDTWRMANCSPLTSPTWSS